MKIFHFCENFHLILGEVGSILGFPWEGIFGQNDQDFDHFDQKFPQGKSKNVAICDKNLSTSCRQNVANCDKSHMRLKSRELRLKVENCDFLFLPWGFWPRNLKVAKQLFCDFFCTF